MTRTTRRRLLAQAGLGMAGAAALALDASLGGAASTGEIRRGGTLRAGLGSDLPTLDPHRAASFIDRQVLFNLFDKLVDTDESLKITPMLATSWTISPDGKTATFALRQGVRFHDGTPFNAEAAVYNFHRMLFDPAFPSARRWELEPVREVVAVDAYTIRLVMDRPHSPLLFMLADRAGMMASPAAAEKARLDFARRPVGAGPFMFAEWVPQDHVTLRRNPAYWAKGIPYVDEIVFRVFIDNNVRVANLKSGDLDIITPVPLPQVKALAQEAARPGARFRLIQRGPIGWSAIALNVTVPPFNNKLLRQAFSATINRDVLANGVLQGAAYPAYSPFPTGTPANDPSWTLPPASVSVARERLRAAGQPGGFSFTLTTVPGQQQQAITQAIQAMAAEAGIQMKIEIMEAGVLIARGQALQNQAVFITFSGRPEPDWIYLFVTRSGLGVGNYSGYTDPRVQELLDRARAVFDMGQRRRIYADVTKILADDVPWVWLYFPKEYKLVSTRVQGSVDQPDGVMRFRTVSLSS